MHPISVLELAKNEVDGGSLSRTCVYDGVSVQNGEFWSVNVLAQSGDVAGNEPDGNTTPSAATAAAAMFLAPLPQAWGADPSTLNPSTYWDSISFGLDAISQ